MQLPVHPDGINCYLTILFETKCNILVALTLSNVGYFVTICKVMSSVNAVTVVTVHCSSGYLVGKPKRGTGEFIAREPA